jgi:hypothetical protein
MRGSSSASRSSSGHRYRGCSSGSDLAVARACRKPETGHCRRCRGPDRSIHPPRQCPDGIGLWRSGRRCRGLARPCRRSPGPAAAADQGRGQAGPAEVQFGQVPPGGAQAGGNAASHGRLRDVGRGEAHRGHQAGIQVAPYVPLVPVEQHRPGLAAVPPVRILHADRRSRATPRRSASAGPEQSTSWSRTWRATATAAAAASSPARPAMNTSTWSSRPSIWAKA